MDTLTITARSNSSGLSAISAKEIALFLPNDVGEVLQKLPGITIKNYGGIGGMKTVSVRGLGSVYQQIVLDGFCLSSTQTGQVDLSNLSASDVASVELIAGGFSNELLPVSSIFGANVLRIERRDDLLLHKKYHLNAKLTYGSFGTFEAYLHNKIKMGNKSQLSIGGSYRSSEGNYPFHFRNFTQDYSGKRMNSDLKEVNANLNFLWQLSPNIKLKVDYSLYGYDKGLPGAVILYLNAANQRLFGWTNRANFGLDFSQKNGDSYLYMSYLDDQMTYLDNGFLNAQGFLQSQYFQKQLSVGYTQKNQISRFLEQKFGIEAFGALLNGNISNDIQPRRFQGKTFYDFEFHNNWFLALARISGQSLSDFDRNKTIGKIKFYFQPGIHFQTIRDWKIIGNLSLFAKRTVRVPGFNDLYYNQVGNKQLIPETADQIQLSFSKSYRNEKSKHEYGLNAYFNREQNKIVAIPTKNLFVWMIQNVGKVDVFGTDIQYRWIKFLHNWNFSIAANYTYQSVKDKTDRESSTFNNQIAYYPEHVGNLDFSVKWKDLGFSATTFGVSKRYALNENISANEAQGYVTVDMQVSYQFKFAKTQSLTARFMLKNLGNVNYAYIKYYVMPGLNYLISLSYEL